MEFPRWASPPNSHPPGALWDGGYMSLQEEPNWEGNLQAAPAGTRGERLSGWREWMPGRGEGEREGDRDLSGTEEKKNSSVE